MKNHIMAWRNLWRNRRRTMITAASVFFAIFFAIFFRSLQIGSYDHMYANAIESYSGYLQVQQEEWWNDKTVDHAFPWTGEIKSLLLKDQNVKEVVPRFESFMLASSGPNTKGVMVIGIDPEKEQEMSGIADKKVKYKLTREAVRKIEEDHSLPIKTREITPKFVGTSYTTDSRLLNDLGLDHKNGQSDLPLIAQHARFRNGDIRTGEPGVWIGSRLSDFMELGIGDTLILLGQGYHGTTAAGKYEIKGIVKQPLPDIDNKIVYLPLDIAQRLFHAEGMLTSVALDVKKTDDKAVRATAERLESVIPGSTRIVTWHEMNEVMIQQMEADNKSGMIMIGILYLVIAFGVFGTVLMMTAERRREFGVLVAIGMQKKKLAAVITCEMLYIGMLGILAGAVVGIPFITFGVSHPLVFKGEMALIFEEYGMEPKLVFNPVSYYFLWQILIVILMVLVSLLHPVNKILNLKVVNALRA
jgi:ABC-type lipoprotein release transport system permease subunit